MDTEESCIRRLEKIRWNGKLICPNGCKKPVWRLQARKNFYECSNCGKQFNVIAGTIFERSRGGVSALIAVMETVVWESKDRKAFKSLSVKDVSEIGKTSRKTAWFRLQKIRRLFEQNNVARRSRFLRANSNPFWRGCVGFLKGREVIVLISGTEFPEIQLLTSTNEKDSNFLKMKSMLSKLTPNEQMQAQGIFQVIKKATNCRDQDHLILMLAEMEFRLNVKEPRKRMRAIVDELLTIAMTPSQNT